MEFKSGVKGGEDKRGQRQPNSIPQNVDGKIFE